ncbi:hypothetical protein J2Y58_001624 [Sphingomonas sp. BE138]|uniref:spike base protein, RCAP_Rcc01079 family n=1 Tax=Sphingomonas sp. BE138 TaxID=2817845 RepID=UPI00285DF17C|nr:hypothetical protein [Sphingomonas sp. BE138]MDR6788266.1 hypothetical protein [Sphingomonas sp. BE138]
MPDKFQNSSDSAAAPATAPFAIVPDDANPLPNVPKGIYVGTGGTITLRGVGGTEDVTYRNLPDASYVAVRALFVRATGTTAANLIAEA